MNLSEVLTQARALMDAHALESWSLGLDRARRRAGQTDHAHQRITLSRHLMALYGEAEVRETILHEIAHARVGVRHGHDAVWAAEAQRIGSSGRRLVAAEAPRVNGRWTGYCPAGHTVNRVRRPSTPLSCSRCARRFSLDHLLAWSHDGVPVADEELGEHYARVLHAARTQRAPRPQ